MARQKRTTVNGDALEREIRKSLWETRQATEESLIRAIDKTTKEVIDRAKGKAPRKTGVYKKNFTSQAAHSVRGYYRRTMYNKEKPGLTHLLQHGHGGPQPAGPHPHIPTDAEIEKILEENLEKEMSKT